MTSQSNDREFVALIGDMRESGKLADRNEVQDQFQALIAELNTVGAPEAIASPFTVTTGDEFQGLLIDATVAVQAAITATERFGAASLRFGIGRGELATAVNRDQAIGMDGPCFYRARRALEAAGAEAGWIRVAGWSEMLDQHVNQQFSLVQCVREDWTDRQAQYAAALKEEGSQKGVCERYGVAKSTVSESLAAGHVQEVHAAERSLATLLHETFQGEA